MSIVGRRGSPVILVTDDQDAPLRETDFGAIAMNGQTLVFRVWNNKDGLVAIPKAVDIGLVLKASPKSGHSILLSDDYAVRGKCTYSAKLGTDPGISYAPFPLENTQFDEIGSGEYNEYEIILDGTQLSDDHKVILNDKEWKVYIVVESTSGGLELVQP